MVTKYKFATDAGPKDWVALPRDFKAGEEIFRYDGYDYGCSRDDMTFGGYETISCCLVAGETPFFTVPVNLLLDEDRKKPRGAYARITA
jgi:hypothetical protein